MQFVILATLLFLMMPNLALGQRNILLERLSDAGCSTLIREVAGGTMKFFLMHLVRPDCEESPWCVHMRDFAEHHNIDPSSFNCRLPAPADDLAEVKAAQACLRLDFFLDQSETAQKWPAKDEYAKELPALYDKCAWSMNDCSQSENAFRRSKLSPQIAPLRCRYWP